MTTPDRTADEIRADLSPDLDAREREQLVEIGIRLRARKALPRPEFRGDMRRRLIAEPAGDRAVQPKPRSIPALVSLYMVFGTLFLAVAAVGVAGAGPFAAT
jgi:hypothetical protein